MRSSWIKLLLTALLAAGSGPAWALHSVGGHGRTLACVHACAVSNSLLTHGGRLAGLSDGDCGVRVRPAVPATSALKASGLAAPVVGALAAAVPSPLRLSQSVRCAAAGRAPPPRLYLLCRHPSSQAPPTFL